MPNLPSNAPYTANSGISTTQPFIVQFQLRNPTSADVNYSIQQPWVNTLTDESWILEGFSTVGGFLSAIWSKTGSGNLTIETLTGNTGGAVGSSGPPNYNINTLGAAPYTVTGDPATNTLTWSDNGGIAYTYTEDTGMATPAANNLNIKGTSAQGIVTSGAGSTVTITADNASSTQKGVASFNSSEFTVTAGAVASNPITVTSTGGTVTITGSPVNLGGTVNLEVASGKAFSSINTQVFTTTGTYTPTTGMSYCYIRMCGGGAGGAGSVSTSGNLMSVGTGGGGGETSEGVFTAAAIGASKAVTIGAGGAGGNAANGSNGGTTSVGSLISANGGSGGLVQATAQKDAAYAGGLGGTGTSIAGVFSFSGGAGGSCYGMSVAADGNSIAITGSGGSSTFGGGAIGVGQYLPGTNTGGVNGTNYGSGGSGGGSLGSASTSTGGNGAPGVVIVTEYIV